MSNLPSHTKNQLIGMGTPSIGDILITERCDLLEVIGVSTNDKGELIIQYKHAARDYTSSAKWDELRSRFGSKCKILHGTLDEVRAEALRALSDPTYLPGLDSQAQEADTFSLAVRSSPKQIEAYKNHAQALRDRAVVLQRIAMGLMAPLQEMAERMASRVAHLQDMLSVIEAYAGVYENVQMIRDGEPAPMETPISIRQLILYMDEEAGITEWIAGKIGITWRSVDHFDAWILADPKHLNQVAPEQKCIVAIHPSRRKEESQDRFYAMQEEQANLASYILIRNGEKVYRVATGFGFGKILFPRQGEFAEVVEAAKKEREAGDDKYYAQGTQLSWQRNIAILQGLIERTECFQPLPHPINLFKPETIGDALNLIRDAEMTLSDGRPSWLEWREQEFNRIQRGDRIIFGGLTNYSRDDYASYFLRDYQSGRPSLPEPGIYTVESIQEYRFNKKFVRFLYMPSDDRWDAHNFCYVPRTNRVTFQVSNSDARVLRYESLDIETIDYYISRRDDRRHFLDLMPTLHEARRKLVTEQEQEDQFVELLKRDMAVPETDIRAAIQWWKTKVISKRPIVSDDAKAWRMIRQRIKSKTTLPL